LLYLSPFFSRHAFNAATKAMERFIEEWLASRSSRTYRTQALPHGLAGQSASLTCSPKHPGSGASAPHRKWLKPHFPLGACPHGNRLKPRFPPGWSVSFADLLAQASRMCKPPPSSKRELAVDLQQISTRL
jgi:hypothetical protein